MEEAACQRGVISSYMCDLILYVWSHPICVISSYLCDLILSYISEIFNETSTNYNLCINSLTFTISCHRPPPLKTFDMFCYNRPCLIKSLCIFPKSRRRPCPITNSHTFTIFVVDLIWFQTHNHSLTSLLQWPVSDWHIAYVSTFVLVWLI